MTTKKRTTKQKLSWNFGGIKGNLGMVHSQIKAIQSTVYCSLNSFGYSKRSGETNLSYQKLNKSLGALTYDLVIIERELENFRTLIMQDVELELEYQAKLLEEQQYFNHLYLGNFTYDNSTLDANLEKYYNATQTCDNKTAALHWKAFIAWATEFISKQTRGPANEKEH